MPRIGSGGARGRGSNIGDVAKLARAWRIIARRSKVWRPWLLRGNSSAGGHAAANQLVYPLGPHWTGPTPAHAPPRPASALLFPHPQLMARAKIGVWIIGCKGG